ncbi:MAG: polysaccharide deacetylase family protein [Hyphomicrobiaceae bacterium]
MLQAIVALPTAVIALLVVHQPALACTGKLGVGRTVTIDTEGDPLHGGLQYKTASLLRDGEVVLTFDDGPLRSKTRRVLAALKDHCTKGTFFMVGRMAVADPSMVREVASAGHTIASHTWSHKNLKHRSARRAMGEIELGISAIQHALGKPVAPFFRFPYLSDTNAMIAYNKNRKIAMFSIDIDSYDYRTRSADRVHRTIMRQLASRKKGIILFHDIQVSTARAMQRILDSLKAKKFKVVHIKAKTTIPTVSIYDAQAAELHAKRRYSPSIRPVTGVAPSNFQETSSTALSDLDRPKRVVPKRRRVRKRASPVRKRRESWADTFWKSAD